VLAVGVVTWVVVAGSGDDGPAASTVQQHIDIPRGGPQVGDVAPDFTATTLDGATVKLSDYTGRPVVLNFWASWCTACRNEFPLFREELARSGGDYVMLGIDNRDVESDAKAFANEKRADWSNAFDSSNAIYKAYGVTALPQTFFIKPDGTIGERYFQAIPDKAAFRKSLATITG
jgi:cytochrome c biogenesis protein CcmG/thiol:disulfide interchange protein DsbE